MVKKKKQILYAMSMSHLTKQLGIASVCFDVVYTAFLVFDWLNIRKVSEQICLTISTFSFSLVLLVFYKKSFLDHVNDCALREFLERVCIFFCCWSFVVVHQLSFRINLVIYGHNRYYTYSNTWILDFWWCHQKWILIS